jgi:hypothetical protein
VLLRVPSANHRDLPIFADLACELPFCCGCRGAIAGSTFTHADGAGKNSTACVEITCTVSRFVFCSSDRSCREFAGTSRSSNVHDLIEK